MDEAAEEVVAMDGFGQGGRDGAVGIGPFEFEPAMRSLLVVVREVDAEGVFELVPADDESQSKHSFRIVRTKRSA